MRGEFKPNNYIFAAVGRHNELDHICPNIAFISAAGLNLQQGATCFNFDELEMKHRAIAMSQQKILVADHSKFGKTKPACIGSLTQFDRVITDRQARPGVCGIFPRKRDSHSFLICTLPSTPVGGALQSPLLSRQDVGQIVRT